MKAQSTDTARTIDYWITEITNDLAAPDEEAAPVRARAPRRQPKVSRARKTLRAFSQFFLPEWRVRS
jgi:hypothetical protein